jgi:pimeloyl-ACP methyl ester carboxylesterase
MVAREHYSGGAMSETLTSTLILRRGACTRVFFVSLFLATSLAAQEHVSFTTQDGALIAADLYGKGERGVVLAHGGRFTKESWSKQAHTLADAGFRVLAFDFRGFGESRGPAKANYPAGAIQDGVQYDVLAAVRYLHEHGAKSVSVVGGSFGGWAAAQASIEGAPGEIERLVMLAAYSVDEPQKIKGRKLFIVARDDASGDGPRLPGIQAEYEKTTEPKKLVILEGSAHAQFLFQTDQGERVMREILEFLSAP